METRTVHDEPETVKKTSDKSRAHVSRPENIRMKQGRSFTKRLTGPLLTVWDEYLRDPMATGLITFGALLTESGRLIRNSRKPQRRTKKTTGAEPVEKKADENILH